MKSPINKFLYISFLILTVYYVFFKHDFSDASINLGIALAFDPFDQETSWTERPMWQKAWLIIHLAAVALLFGLTVGLNDK